MNETTAAGMTPRTGEEEPDSDNYVDGKQAFPALSGIQRDILWVVSESEAPLSGSEIGDPLERYYPTEVRKPRLYSNLDTLVEKGLITKEARNRRANEHTLTETGANALLDRQEWEHERLHGEGSA